MNRRAVPLFLCCAFSLSVCGMARADAVADFYRGKTVRLIVGASASGGYGLAGQAMASHWSKYIPGHPTVALEGMPGASSLIMTNYLFNAAPRDGTVMGMPSSSLPLEPRLHLLTRDGGTAKFDIGKFSWIGTPYQEPQLFWTLASGPYKSIGDLTTHDIVAGGTSPSADHVTLPRIMNAFLSTHIKIITGYAGPADFFTAAEKGEIDGAISAQSEIFGRTNLDVLLQFGSERTSALKNVPTAIELAEDDDERQMLAFYALKFKMPRAVIFPPGVPQDRVDAMRAAFDEMVKDPAFAEDSRRLGFEVDPVDGVSITKLIQQIQDTPQPLVDRLLKVISP